MVRASGQQAQSWRNRVGEQKPAGKPFEIPKQEVWDAWLKVKANGGAPGADGQSIEDFEADLKNNLYKVWNRMSSGSYFPPPVKAVEIPKAHGAGTRILGIPTVADRVAQTVVAARLEKEVEPKFHDDSYGYRPGRSALDAVGKCRERCWKHDWVVDLDIRKFFDSVPWDFIVKAVEANTADAWVILYVKRWLSAPLQMPDGSLAERDRGTPRDLRFHLYSLTCSCITRSICGWRGSSRQSRSSGTSMTPWCTAARRSRPGSSGPRWKSG